MNHNPCPEVFLFARVVTWKIDMNEQIQGKVSAVATKNQSYKSYPIKTKACYCVVALAVSLGMPIRVWAASTIQFTATTYSTSEGAGTATLGVQRTGDTNTEVGVDYASWDGTATNGLRYTAVSGKLVFAANEISKSIVVPILDNGLVEGPKTFGIALSNPTGGALVGSRGNATVYIADNDFGVQFQLATYSVGEDTNAVMIGIVRGDDGILPVTVDFFTSDLTAKSGLDYDGITNTLLFAAQERLKFVSVPIINNSLKQPNRNFRVTLANPTGASLGDTKAITVTVVDNDQGFQFDFTSQAVSEDVGVVPIGVLRGTDDTNSTVAVDLATSNLTAADGLDYRGITNTLSFAPGERIKRVTVPILNNGVKQATRNFQLTLTNPTAGGVLGSPKTTTVSILDNDPGLGFELARYTNSWRNTGVTLTVLRGNDGVLGPVTVDYATSDATARAGLDYQAVSGTLQFRENETVKSITIPLLRDRVAEGAVRNFRVTLSHITGGATLGTSVTIISIMGSYFTVAPPFETALTIRPDLRFNTISWAGGGLLQRADSSTGPWQTLTAAKSPTTFHSSLPTTFYRVSRPRPVSVYVPSSYVGQTPAPLVILLHGRGGPGAGDFEESYMQLRPWAEARGFLYCHPDGTIDGGNNQFWNATDSCCDFLNTGIDDAGYLRAVIEEIGRQFAVDPKRVYLVGHSNGAFMAYRMACQSADLIAGIACLSGMTFLDPNRCAPSQPVNILHIQGTQDSFFYNGGTQTISLGFPSNTPPFPGLQQTIQFWAGYNGARDPVTDPAPLLNLDSSLPGLDTVITRYTNYPPGGAVELWTINGGMHYPTLSAEFAPRVIDWLLAHPKP
jgi:polyhydroxybutyrate depolymerase